MAFSEITYEAHNWIRVIRPIRREIRRCITGRVISATEALSVCLANEVVSNGQSLDRAPQLARYLCALPQPALRSDKEAAIRGVVQSLTERLRIEAECFNRFTHHPVAYEDLRRFSRIPGQAVTPGLIRS